jgi:hypothetical protein
MENLRHVSDCGSSSTGLGLQQNGMAQQESNYPLSLQCMLWVFS